VSRFRETKTGTLPKRGHGTILRQAWGVAVSGRVLAGAVGVRPSSYFLPARPPGLAEGARGQRYYSPRGVSSPGARRRAIPRTPAKVTRSPGPGSTCAGRGACSAARASNERRNIRPFVQAGILRTTPNPNLRQTRGRGKEPERPQEVFPRCWEGGTFKGAGAVTFT
jgi:hypothetical protein